jgi:hypothetical protein
MLAAMTAHRTVPTLRPDWGRPRAGMYLERACFASAVHAAKFPETRSAEAFAKQRWGDGVTELIIRGATMPATIADADWAGAVAPTAVGDFISSLSALSAAARLFDAAPRASLDGVQQLHYPRRLGAIDPSKVPWVGELGAIPVLPFVVEPATLGPPKKLAAIAVATRELIEGSNGEQVIRQLVRENAALSLDASLFSNLPATAARPAGIMNGVAPLTPTAGSDAMMADLGMLAVEIGSVTAGLAYVAHPSQASAIKLGRGTLWPADVPVWPTLGVAAGTVIALDPAAFVSAFGSEPEISSSKEALLQTESTPGGDPMAGPTTSLFQVDMIATKLILPAAWTWRVSGAVAWIDGATW